jgi:hypothetical protein
MHQIYVLTPKKAHFATLFGALFRSHSMQCNALFSLDGKRIPLPKTGYLPPYAPRNKTVNKLTIEPRDKRLYIGGVFSDPHLFFNFLFNRGS